MPTLLKAAWLIVILALVFVLSIEMTSWGAQGDCEYSQVAQPQTSPCDDCQDQGDGTYVKCNTLPSPVNMECNGNQQSSYVDGTHCEATVLPCDGEPTVYQSLLNCYTNTNPDYRGTEECPTTYDIADVQDYGDEPVCPIDP